MIDNFLKSTYQNILCNNCLKSVTMSTQRFPGIQSHDSFIFTMPYYTTSYTLEGMSISEFNTLSNKQKLSINTLWI